MWCGMRARCHNPNHISFRYYGAKGIQVTSPFDSYLGFKTWAMAAGYKKGLTLDRIDNNANYCPKNCRWVNWKTQNRNTSHARSIPFKGKALSLEEWSEITGIKAATIRGRLKRKWPIWKALTKGKTK